jgi:hypothetical protein
MTTTTLMRLDGQQFHLQPGTDTPELRDSVLTATRTGPAWVHFTAAGRGDISVLMAPGMSALFEVLTHDDAPDSSDDDGSLTPLTYFDDFS